ncbi:hypothetical protein SAMN04489752_3098 [Brevibacterium siliguriense]|uniref:PknH-like extracellular domain-containing protein n=1 Tax=Brevibacterium siliguriense TaxID=1136497 RepID=A0A1H1WVH4_9MICO|nr:hypothetical protein [Brevibacterium siliguriense]SDT00650.1 hypothetical protein SAMN04489752_3098 [Brevibacterium siliguriense]
MKRILPAIALFAGLSLVGCTSGGDKPNQADGGGESPGAEAQPEAKKIDEAQLKKVLESTKVDGQSFKAVDGVGDANGEMAKALESSEFEPAKCKDITLDLINSNIASGGTTVAGASSDNVLSAGLSSFDSVDDAQSQLDGTAKIAEECSDVKMKTAGMEMSLKYSTFDAEVAGADETSGVVASVEAGGQTATEIRIVTARAENNLVSVTNLADVEEATVTQAASTFVEEVKKAG